MRPRHTRVIKPIDTLEKPNNKRSKHNNQTGDSFAITAISCILKPAFFTSNQA